MLLVSKVQILLAPLHGVRIVFLIILNTGREDGPYDKNREMHVENTTQGGEDASRIAVDDIAPGHGIFNFSEGPMRKLAR